MKGKKNLRRPPCSHELACRSGVVRVVAPGQLRLHEGVDGEDLHGAPGATVWAAGSEATACRLAHTRGRGSGRRTRLEAAGIDAGGRQPEETKSTPWQQTETFRSGGDGALRSCRHRVANEHGERRTAVVYVHAREEGAHKLDRRSEKTRPWSTELSKQRQLGTS
jgi:hypothetical protein